MKTVLRCLGLAMAINLSAICTVAADGPGMVVHFASLKRDVTTNIKAARLPSGVEFPHAGSIGPNKKWRTDGATMGAAPDGRELPEWVEFEWQEWPSSYKRRPSDPEAQSKWSTEIRELSKSLPHQTQRVPVRSRVPIEAVEEMMRSKRAAQRGKLPDKWLWINFIWTDDGIKMHWSLERMSPNRSVERVISSGGDTLVLDWIESGAATTDGPGTMVHFASLKPGVSIETRAAGLPDGREFRHGGSIGPNTRWETDGKIQGTVFDGRELPEWVEFAWQEWAYPYPVRPEKPELAKAWNAELRALFATLPWYTQRVPIRDRVPAVVVEESMRSQRSAQPGQLPDKLLWTHFVWTEDGIKFRWSLEWSSPGSGVERVLSSGGDMIDNR